MNNLTEKKNKKNKKLHNKKFKRIMLDKLVMKLTMGSLICKSEMKWLKWYNNEL